MFKQFLQKVVGADIFMITSMLLFMAFFIAVAVWLYQSDKQYIDEMKNKPLN